MRDLGDVGWVVESSWLKEKPCWSADYVIASGKGYYCLFETKKKALVFARMVCSCGKKVRLMKWKKCKTEKQ